MTAISKRIQYILEHYNLTAGQFAEKLGIQKSSVSHLLSGRNKPSFQFLSKLVKAFPEINLNWFITGEGDIFYKSEQDSEYENLSKVKNQPDNDKTLQEFESQPIQKKSADESGSTANQLEQIIMVYHDDTFKILKKR